MDVAAKWVNPYKHTLGDYPGRIFCFKDFESDCEQVRCLSRTRTKVICEIGSGSGNHLLGLAARDQSASCFGFELRYKRVVRTMQKADNQRLLNVYVLHQRGQAVDAVFGEQVVDAVFINFPEPWPRERWRKHRILSGEYLSKLEKVLKPGGYIAVKSDAQQYFASFVEEIEQSSVALTELTYDLYRSEYLATNIPTEFECLFRSKGLPIAYLKAVKRS